MLLPKNNKNNNNKQQRFFVLLMTIAPSCLHRHGAQSMFVSTTNQKRAATSSSLKIEEVEEKADVANQDGRQWGSNPGPVASKSGPCLLSCVAV